MTAQQAPAPAKQASVRSRFDAAADAARASGVTVVVNVMTCCRSCTTFAHLGLPEGSENVPVAWHFGGQGNELDWTDDNHPVFLDEERECYCEDTCGEDEDDPEWEECDVCRYGTLDRDSRPAERLILNFQPDDSAARRVREAFDAQGFRVEGGSGFSAVTVRLA